MDQWAWKNLSVSIDTKKTKQIGRSRRALVLLFSKCKYAWNFFLASLLSSVLGLLYDWAWFIYGIVRIFRTRGEASLVLKLEEGRETSWGFGQLMPVFLLTLPMFMTLELWEGVFPFNNIFPQNHRLYTLMDAAH